jgi:hypothetical protein
VGFPFSFTQFAEPPGEEDCRRLLNDSQSAIRGWFRFPGAWLAGTFVVTVTADQALRLLERVPPARRYRDPSLRRQEPEPRGSTVR